MAELLPSTASNVSDFIGRFLGILAVVDMNSEATNSGAAATSASSQIQLNGVQQPFVPHSTIASLLEQLQIPTRGVAVELNEQIVPRSQHALRTLQPGDRLEVVSLVGGG